MTAKTAPFRYTVSFDNDSPRAAFRYQVDAEQWATYKANLLRNLSENAGALVSVLDAAQSNACTYVVRV